MKHCHALLYFALSVIAGCTDDYDPLLICHNANCVEPANPAEDDSIEALRASLALTRAGRPVIDGVEVDTFWFGAEDRCIFAHDLESDTDIEATRAAEVLNEALLARLDSGKPLTRTGAPFALFVELKGHVGSEAELHTSAQRTAHAACAMELATIVADAAAAREHEVEIAFTSFEPALLTAVTSSPAYPALADAATIRLGALQGIPAPLDGQSRPLDRFGPEVDFVDIHPQWVTESELQAYASRNWDLAYWMFSVTPETFDAIERDRPRWITTSEATTFARWLDR